jgi:hypothetical protein
VNGESLSLRNAFPTTLLVDFLSWFALDPPPTVERIQQACMLNDFGAP